MSINGKTKTVGLFGYPVAHTASPEMHNAAFKALGLNFVYLPFEVEPAFLKQAVKSLPYLGIKGVNLTVPHKVNVFPYLDWINPEARVTRAVNTVVVKGKKLYGYNTDVRGFIEDFKEKAKISPKGREIFILGAGGAGRACAVGFAKEKAAKINIADSLPSRGLSLLKILKSSYSNVRLECVSGDALSRAVCRSKIIINATPLGMKKDDPLPLKKEWLNKEKIIYDLVYTPCPTKFLKLGRSRGARVISGIGMLARQGAVSFNLWTGRRAPLKIMQKVLNDKYLYGISKK
jgi:shikimate dehydrogenase